MISYSILEYDNIWRPFVAARAFSVFLKSAKFVLYFALLGALLLELERENWLEVGYMAYLLLGEGVCYIFILIQVAANCFFLL